MRVRYHRNVTDRATLQCVIPSQQSVVLEFNHVCPAHHGSSLGEVSAASVDYIKDFSHCRIPQKQCGIVVTKKIGNIPGHCVDCLGVQYRRGVGGGQLEDWLVWPIYMTGAAKGSRVCMTGHE